MSTIREPFVGAKKRGISGITLALLFAGTGAARNGNEAVKMNEKQIVVTPSKFYCHINGLNPAERAHHKQLTDKLMAVRKRVVEMEKGYEFQYSPAEVSLAELADWVRAEAKCCPFFDFHIDLENQGALLCLRLTGEEGIKQFIRAEFEVRGK